MKLSDLLLVIIALVATGIILEVGVVYGENLFSAPPIGWPIWEPVTETQEPLLALREMNG